MDEPKINFVERRALREKSLKDNAETAWHDVRSAIQNCCESFRALYNEKLKVIPENTHRLRITLPFQVENPPLAPREVHRTIVVHYNAGDACIEVTVDRDTPRVFPLDADQPHAFIVERIGGEEIKPDEFAEKVLDAPLFKAPIRKYHSSLVHSDFG